LTPADMCVQESSVGDTAVACGSIHPETRLDDTRPMAPHLPRPKPPMKNVGTGTSRLPDMYSSSSASGSAPSSSGPASDQRHVVCVPCVVVPHQESMSQLLRSDGGAGLWRDAINIMAPTCATRFKSRSEASVRECASEVRARVTQCLHFAELTCRRKEGADAKQVVKGPVGLVDGVQSLEQRAELALGVAADKHFDCAHGQ